VRSRYLVREEHQAHFVTSTIVDWLPAFTTSGCCDIVTEALDYCRRHKELKLYGCDGAIPVIRCDDWRQVPHEERNRVSREDEVPKQTLGTRTRKTQNIESLPVAAIAALNRMLQIKMPSDRFGPTIIVLNW
jgi:hypothetical protein